MTEEDLLRELGVGQDILECLHTYNWAVLIENTDILSTTYRAVDKKLSCLKSDL